MPGHTPPTSTSEPPGVGSVRVNGPVMMMIGDVDRAAVRAAVGLHDRQMTALADITTVDLTRADHLGSDALHLLLRCLQVAQRRQPPARLRVIGIDRRTRGQLELLGVVNFLDIAS